MDLSDFLLARIAEDEAAARDVAKASPGAWGALPVGLLGLSRHMSHVNFLAECDAKRRIVEGGHSECSDYGPPGSDVRTQGEEIAASLGVEYRPHWPETYSPFCDGCAAAQSADRQYGWVLRLLALPYAEHPEYRAEWRP